MQVMLICDRLRAKTSEADVSEDRPNNANLLKVKDVLRIHVICHCEGYRPLNSYELSQWREIGKYQETEREGKLNSKQGRSIKFNSDARKRVCILQ